MMMPIALLLAALPPQQDAGQHMLDRMSMSMSEHVAPCGVKVVFRVKPGGMVKDSQGVIEKAATPEQIACVKGMVSWLITWDEARKAGIVR